MSEIIEMQAGKYTVYVNKLTLHGYYEHDRCGEDMSGGLWFEVKPDGHMLKLRDYDGMYEIPEEVVEALRQANIDVTDYEGC